MGYEVAKSSDPYIGRRLFGGDGHLSKSNVVFDGLKGNVISSKHVLCKGVFGGKRQNWFHRNLRSIGFTIGLMVLLFWLDSVLFPEFESVILYSSFVSETKKKDDGLPPSKNESSSIVMYGRLLNLASASLAEKEFRDHQSYPWKESPLKSSVWTPCADRKSSETRGSRENNNGYIIVSANGGLNQQRVAVCNAVAVASLLNATLVVPRFLYSTVWKDPSQFGDIYQEEHFINTMKDDIPIVKDLPAHLKSLDLEAIGSVITDADLEKEAKPDDFMRLALPILLRNGVVHFLGFGNRLGFDPLPPHLQKLRCKCNFHALKFAPKIQDVGSLLVKRIRKHSFSRSKLDKELLGNFLEDDDHIRKQETDESPTKYLALHLRFEIDMVAYSFCEFGGGDSEKKELQSYREAHFPLLLKRLEKLQPVSPEELRMSGRCPLTPEETVLLLSGVGVKRGTFIYLAGSQLYGGSSRMMPFTSLYPNLVTKEDLLSPDELEPFRNFSSQLAALDFIACATADIFAMTDTGSQLSSLVTGFRTYFGGGKAPILRPNKRRLAMILSENGTIGWDSFRDRLKKMIDEDQRVQVRRRGQSIYRLPRSPECMCKGG